MRKGNQMINVCVLYCAVPCRAVLWCVGACVCVVVLFVCVRCCCCCRCVCVLKVYIQVREPSLTQIPVQESFTNETVRPASSGIHEVSFNILPRWFHCFTKHADPKTGPAELLRISQKLSCLHLGFLF